MKASHPLFALAHLTLVAIAPVACSATTPGTSSTGTSATSAGTSPALGSDAAPPDKPGAATSASSAAPGHGTCVADADCRLVHDCHCACVAADLASATQIDCADTPCAKND